MITLHINLDINQEWAIFQLTRFTLSLFFRISSWCTENKQRRNSVIIFQNALTHSRPTSSRDSAVRGSNEQRTCVVSRRRTAWSSSTTSPVRHRGRASASEETPSADEGPSATSPNLSPRTQHRCRSEQDWKQMPYAFVILFYLLAPNHAACSMK